MWTLIAWHLRPAIACRDYNNRILSRIEGQKWLGANAIPLIDFCEVRPFQGPLVRKTPIKGVRMLRYSLLPSQLTRPTMQDLSKYSIAQLRALEVQVIDELKTRHFLSISKAREQILHIAQRAGLSEKDLRAIKTSKTSRQSTVEVKYRNPADPTQQWSGRGRQPAWVKAWIASGKSLEEAKA